MREPLGHGLAKIVVLEGHPISTLPIHQQSSPKVPRQRQSCASDLFDRLKPIFGLVPNAKNRRCSVTCGNPYVRAPANMPLPPKSRRRRDEPFRR